MSKEIFELLRADNIIHVNRTLAAAIGLNEAVIYSALLGKEYYYRSVGQLDGEGMFYATASDLTERTTLTQRQQDRAVTRLEEFNLISTKLKGMPAKKYFRINEDAGIILALLKGEKEIAATEPSNNDGNSNPGSEPNNSGNKPLKKESETRFDKMLKLDSTEGLSLLQQNVETSIGKTAKQDLTKSENMNQPNSETILNINNNKNINKKNKYTNACAREEKNGFDDLINNFTENENLRTAINEYIKMRLQKPKTITTEYTLAVILKRLTELSLEPEIQIKILEQSIIHSYPDLYELKKAGENNDRNGNYSNSGGTDKAYFTGLVSGKDNKPPDFPGVVKLG
jgi:hypothetical protein